MVTAFCALLMFDVVAAAALLLLWGRLREHLRGSPEAARLLCEHVVYPLLFGHPCPGERPEPKRTGRLV